MTALQIINRYERKMAGIMTIGEEMPVEEFVNVIKNPCNKEEIEIITREFKSVRRESFGLCLKRK